MTTRMSASRSFARRSQARSVRSLRMLVRRCRVAGKLLESNDTAWLQRADGSTATWSRRHHRSRQGGAYALQDAASVAGLLITTEAMVAQAPKKKAVAAMPGGACRTWAAWVAWASKVRFTQASSSRSQIEPEKPQANAKPQIERSAVFLSNRCNRRPGRNNGRKQRLIDKQVEDKSSQEIHLSRGLKYARSLRALIV